MNFSYQELNSKLEPSEPKYMLKYLMNPTLDKMGDASSKDKLKGTLLTFIIYLAATIVVSIILSLIDSLIIEYFFHHSILQQIKLNNQDINKEFGRYSFLIIVLIGPLYEEMIFRLPLRLEKIAIGLSVGLICYRLSIDHLFAFEFYNLYSYIKVAIALIIFLLIANFLPDSLLIFIKRNFSYFFYLVAIIFALFHLSNFTYFNRNVLLFYPLFTLPQFVMALFIGYVRMKYGFFYGVGFHSLINLPVFLIGL